MTGRKINLAINGRGPQGVAAIGVLQVMDEKGLLDKIGKAAGASVGAMLCFLLAIGWEVKQIEELAAVLQQFLDKSDNPIRNINRFLHEHGYFKGKRLHEWAQEQVEKALGNPNATFKDLHERVQEIRKRGKRYKGDPRFDVYMQVSNITDEVGMLLSYKNEGNFPLADALSAAASIVAGYPWVNIKRGVDGEFLKNPDGSLRRFKPDETGVISLVDSGVTDNYPVDFADHGSDREFKNDNTIGIFMHKNPAIKQPPVSFFKNVVLSCLSYFNSTLRKSLVATGKIINTLRKSQYSESNEYRTIHVAPTDGVGLLTFDLTKAQIEEMIQQGREAALDFFENRWQKLPGLRPQQQLEKLYRMEKENFCREAYLVYFSVNSETERAVVQLYYDDKDRAKKIAQTLVYHSGVRPVTIGAHKDMTVVSFHLKKYDTENFRAVIQNNKNIELEDVFLDNKKHEIVQRDKKVQAEEQPEKEEKQFAGVSSANQKKWQALWDQQNKGDDYLSMVTNLLYSESRAWYDVRFWQCCCTRTKNSAERLMKYLNKPKWANKFKNPENLLCVINKDLECVEFLDDVDRDPEYYQLLCFLKDKLELEFDSKKELSLYYV